MASQKTVGVLLFEGFELLDVFGPLEAWGMHAEIAGACTIVTAAEKAGAVKSAQGPRAMADYALADCPQIDVMLVPGGIGTRREVENPPAFGMVEAARGTSGNRELRMHRRGVVGARRIARRTPRDLQQALVEMVTEQGPAVEWVRQARWVEDGKFATSSGVSAGIDMTLAMIARLAGDEVAERVAIPMEYEWHRDPSWDPVRENPRIGLANWHYLRLKNSIAIRDHFRAFPSA